MRRWSLVCCALAALLAATALPASASPGGFVYGFAGYQLRIAPERLGLTVSRHGEPVLRTARDAFTFGNGAVATRVRSVHRENGHILAEADSTAGKTVRLDITPGSDRVELAWSVLGAGVGERGTHFELAPSGHWYGGGETSEGTAQPYPYSAGKVDEKDFSPSSYVMQEPYWYTSKSVGVYVRTPQPMRVKFANGRGDLTVTNTKDFTSTVFLERDRRAVYDAYLREVGKPEKSDAKPFEYAKPLWNSWAQYYRDIDQRKVLDWTKQLRAAEVDGHTIQLDDKWESNYGNMTFDSRTFPDPKKMVEQIHGMGYKFGLWTTFWVNLDSKNYAYARDHGYLVRAKDDPNKACTVKWWNGKAGIIDLANKKARDWYTGKLRKLMQDYRVDGFKFDTRFFDDSCATSNNLTPRDYQRIGADMTDEFDQQGAGIRTHWGNQRYGFVTRAVDADANWDGLRTTLRRSMAISTNGYPFVETDMIGGSNSLPPPSGDLLVRWAQAAALMPLMYSSTSPVSTVDTTTGKPVKYPPQTANEYAKAVRLHEKIAPYIRAQVDRAVRDGSPIMRPVFFDFAKDHRFDTIDDEWMLGPALLAAPMITKGDHRDVVLPRDLWYDPNRHRFVPGGRTLHDYPAPSGVTPMFVRAGAEGATGLMHTLGG
ncbi:glycoside hydrolase family 31 protein [Sciscionella marina]|uniref:glycoside hydrolase family 31 protein n=1 Tax=Sciscionella marina TaxID=508770 RepID=UPI00036DD9B9|nr:glycoside hydrolase family 31 protein [Sciscionella marina]